jgi:hypothetical protein
MRLKLVICIRWIAALGILLILACKLAALLPTPDAVAIFTIGMVAGLTGSLLVPLPPPDASLAGMTVHGAIHGAIAGALVITMAMVIYTYRG